MFKSSRLHFEEMCTQYLMRVEIPLKSALEQSSMPLRVINSLIDINVKQRKNLLRNVYVLSGRVESG